MNSFRFSAALLAWPLLLLALLITAPNRAFAHKLQVEPIVVEVRAQDSFFTVQLRGNGEDVVQAIQVRDDEREFGQLKPAVTPRIGAYINDHLKLKQGGKLLTGEIIRFDYNRPDPDDYTTSTFYAVMRYPRDPNVADKKFEIGTTLFDYLPNAKTFLSIGGTQKLISAGNSVEFDPEAVTANLAGNIKDFAILGVEHIFTGYDHILFIVALLLTATSFWSLVKTLTGFTIAHSITLVLSALSVISLDGKLVEVLVAGSIVFVGLENIYWKNAQKHRFWVASGFGLIHGIGFSDVLREIGLPEQGLAWCLFSFNMGVEIAQVILCAITFPVMMKLRAKLEHEEQYGGIGWPKLMHRLSWGIVAIGGWWLFNRLIS